MQRLKLFRKQNPGDQMIAKLRDRRRGPERGCSCDHVTDIDSDNLCEECRKYKYYDSSEETVHTPTYHDKRRLRRREQADMLYSCVVPRKKSKYYSLFESLIPYDLRYKPIRANYLYDEQKHKQKKPLRIINSEASLREILESSGEFRSDPCLFTNEYKYEGSTNSDEEEEYLEIIHALEKYNARKKQDVNRARSYTQLDQFQLPPPLQEKLCQQSRSLHPKVNTKKIVKSCSVQTSALLPTKQFKVTRCKSAQTSRDFNSAEYKRVAYGPKSSYHVPRNYEKNNSFEAIRNAYQEKRNSYQGKNNPYRDKKGSFQARNNACQEKKNSPTCSKSSRASTSNRYKKSQSGQKMSIYEKKFQQKFRVLSRRAEGRKKNHSKRSHSHSRPIDSKKNSLEVNRVDIEQLANVIQLLQNYRQPKESY